MRTATIELVNVAELADLSFDTFRIIGRKHRPQDVWDYTFSDPLRAMQSMIDDGHLIVHHTRNDAGCQLLIARRSKHTTWKR